MPLTSSFVANVQKKNKKNICLLYGLKAGVGRSKKGYFLCALKDIIKDNFFEQKKIMQ